MESTEEIGASGEEENIAFPDEEVEMAVEVGKEKVDEVEERGADRRESNFRLKWGYAIVENGKRVDEVTDVIVR